MSNTSSSCVYIGLGHMGLPVYRATNASFRRNGWSVRAVDLNPRRLALIDEEGVVASSDLPSAATVAFIGVRPQDFAALANKAFQPEIVVSMMAGIKVETIRRAYPSARVIRIIPNTPCEFRSGITPIYAEDPGFTDVAGAMLLNALSETGKLLPVPREQMIDGATGISAGGPAYMMLVAQSMIEAGLEIGFSPAEARALIAHTLLGSASLLLQTDKSPDRLASEVMTPNGTTERGMHVLQEAEVGRFMREALLAASGRATELSALQLEGA